MSVFKCKMCGGTLEINENQTIATCEYCGSQQTLPRLGDNKRSNLYDRANHFRRNNEFDKAMGIYEQILNEDHADAEAYWSLVLCSYGIEYVEEPATHKRVPTVNRAQFTSIFDDNNYRSALKYADIYQRNLYEAEAKSINEIQKGILAISQQEDPYDVFICYKETDSNGRRTTDSVLANDLYHQLTQEGFKVFFSRITLEDKLGSAYEPHIFAALNSAKVMVVLGTKPEYFSAVWVKNEWSRYLALIKQGQNKMLVPAYKDMDPYDLPEEFSHLQAQDMSRLGFMQDLIRGIKKITQSDAPQTTVAKGTVIAGGNANTAPLLRRVFMFLEDGDWSSANEYCEKVLDIEPENSSAYLGKLMSELRVRKQESLKDQTKPFDSNNNYKKAVRFADDQLRARLDGYIEYINNRNEIERKNKILAEGKEKMCGEHIPNYESAIQLFESISGWKDAGEQVYICKKKIEEIEANEEADRLQKEIARKEAEYRAERARKEAERKAKRNKKIALIATTIVCVVACAIIAFVFLRDTVIIPNGKYNDAIALMNAGQYEEAISVFEAMDGYKDSAAHIENCNMAILGIKYDEAVALMGSGDVTAAYEALIALDGYKDSNSKANSIYDKYKTEKLKNATVGDYVVFGSYEQDNDTFNGKEEIEWLVLDRADNSILIISKYALDCQQYDSSGEDVTWETCSLRKWLNGTFMNAAFSSEEQVMIPTVTVSADKNPGYSTAPGTATQDKVFLLSTTEAHKYFDSDISRQCAPTNYTVACGAEVTTSNGNCIWWLRSPGRYQDGAACVYSSGGIYIYGLSSFNSYPAVRPALWIDLDAVFASEIINANNLSN